MRHTFAGDSTLIGLLTLKRSFLRDLTSNGVGVDTPSHGFVCGHVRVGTSKKGFR